MHPGRRYVGCFVFAGGRPSQVHSSAREAKLCSISPKGEGRGLCGKSYSSSAVQVGWRRPLLKTLPTTSSCRGRS